jgi:hypothetical protein
MKAMGKTARGCRLRRSRKTKQHPAILPWLSSLPLNRRAIIRPVLQIGSGSLPDIQRICPVSASKRANMPRMKPQRRIPSRSINDL